MKVLLFIVMGTILTHTKASEKLSEISINAEVQQSISNEIEAIDRIQSLDALTSYVNSKCNAIISSFKKNQMSLELVTKYEVECAQKMSNIMNYDLDTAKDLYIFELQEFQTASSISRLFTNNISFVASRSMLAEFHPIFDPWDNSEQTRVRCEGRNSAFCDPANNALALLLLPVAIVVDVIAIPVTLGNALINGF